MFLVGDVVTATALDHLVHLACGIVIYTHINGLEFETHDHLQRIILYYPIDTVTLVSR
jgi:hypothetical protein